MPMNDDLADALNAQITHEFNASYIYLGMAAYFESLDLDGFAGWMRAQSTEEWDHGMRIFNHLAARDVPITLSALLKPKSGYDDPQAAIAAALMSSRPPPTVNQFEPSKQRIGGPYSAGCSRGTHLVEISPLGRS